MKISAFLLVAASCLSASVRADEAPAAPHKVQIKNVPPRLMAWWLDPAHNQGPTQTENLDEFLKRSLTFIVPDKADSSEKTAAKAQGPFVLPEGVEKVAALDAEKVLLVYGTPEGVRELNDTIAFLDRPLRQIEVEAQLVQIDSPEEIGVTLDPNRAPGSLSVGFVRSNYKSILDKLMVERKAKILSAPSVLGVNNFPIHLGVDVPKPEGAEQPKQFFGLSFQVVPTINNDGTVTMLLEISNSPTKATEAPKKELKTRIVFNTKNETPMAVSGFEAREFLSQKEAASSQVVLLLTPYVVRPVSE
jgi:type II secretory pathway component GspD/PulD (secretin)